MIARRLLLAVFFLVFGCVAATARAGTIKVGTDAQTIQAAVDLALANADAADTVIIPSGIYDETVFITVTGTNNQEFLTLKRSGTSAVLIRGTASHAGVAIANMKGVTLKDLTVQSGSLASGGSDDDVAAIDVSGNSANVVIDGCSGVAGDDVGLELRGVDVRGVLVKNCSFGAMTRIGCRIDGRDHTFDSCTANGVGYNGFLFTDTSENCRLVKCSAIGVGASDVDNPGYITVRGTGHQLDDCTATSGADGFYVTGSGHRLSKCSALVNLSSGFECDDATACTFTGCTATQNLVGFTGGGTGVLVEGGKYSSNASHGLFVVKDRTKVMGVRAETNGGTGIYVFDNVLYALVRDCKPKSNGGDGIRVEGDSAWIEDNSASNGDGILDLGASNAGRGNKTKNGAQNDFP